MAISLDGARRHLPLEATAVACNTWPRPCKRQLADYSVQRGVVGGEEHQSASGFTSYII